MTFAWETPDQPMTDEQIRATVWNDWQSVMVGHGRLGASHNDVPMDQRCGDSLETAPGIPRLHCTYQRGHGPLIDDNGLQWDHGLRGAPTLWRKGPA